MAKLDRCANIDDLRSIAKARLPRGIFEFLDRGAEDEIALRENRLAFERVRLTPRYLVDLTDRDLSTRIFGAPVAAPFGVGPTGAAGLLWPQGEVALAQAAAAAGIPFTLATPSMTPMETIAAVGGRLWYQLYLWEEARHSYELVARARDLGFEALVVTIDHGLGHLREHNVRNGYQFPFRPNLVALRDMACHPRWLYNVILRTGLTSGLPTNVNYPREYRRIVAFGAATPPTPPMKTSMTWGDLAYIRELWPRKLVVKGVMSLADARCAVAHGADAIVISNHGGRALDSSRAPIDVLRDVAPELDGSVTIMLDGGVRRGSDVLKALALGADFVLLGRATLYGLAAAGRSGVEKAIELVRDQFEKTMSYVGCCRPDELGRHVIAESSTQR
ncbi:alpha-hydroxy acid oxidase [Blastococcus sp. CT_GayMR20]|uniref:alpha-hydroxy acid oxidase n=1 Tax=Blastococcus sp. CT_GayMR20 TaxID=2559609 RepID=UPI00142F911D|nr:alpha-hydroxy acid oxidase [Blastococcus sp. CT_GayMR20]